MNILLTGGAGYIGSTLVDFLLKENFNVTVIDNFSYESNTLGIYCKNKNFEIINSDIRNYKLLKKIVPKYEFIIPLAGLVGAPLCNFKEVEAKSINYDANVELFKMVNDNQKIIMPTTNSAYGKGKDGQIFTEKSILKPISLYAKHKVLVEEKLMKRKNSISLRLATVFGMSPRMRIDLLVNNFVYKAMFDKYLILFESNFKRNYVHVRDVSRAFVHCIKNFKKLSGNIFNLGLEDANLSKKELCDKIKKYLDFAYFENNYFKDEDQRNYIVSNKKILSTGFKNKYNLDHGIKELIKGYQGITNKNNRNFY
jgi:nucleoside-diphosphate-sugar epimerase